jgi:hypothetical protein
MYRKLAIVPIALSLAGCFGEGALKQASSGSVGCPSDEIEITNDEAGFNLRSWDASCRGHLYHCSGVAHGGITCTEDRSTRAEQAEAQAKAPQGVAPSAPAAPARTWTRFIASECGTSLLLPGTPAEARRVLKTKAGTVNIYDAHVEVDDAIAGISCAALPGTAPINVGNAFDGARDGLLKDASATLESEQDIDLGDAPARDVRFTAEGVKGRARIILRARELVVMELVPLDAFSSTEVKDYFASLSSLATEKRPVALGGK